MCIIIYRPAVHKLDPQTLVNCWNNNSDGWGIMHHDPALGVVTERGMDYPSFIAAYDKLDGKEIGIHMRIKTHGKIDLANTHPFQVLNRETHGREFWIMHNGIIRIEETDKTKSDTWHYVENELRPMLAAGPGLMEVPAFWRHVDERIGTSKFLMLDGNGNFTTLGRSRGTDLFGCWFSNNHSHYSAGRGASYYSGAYYHGGYTPPAKKETAVIPFEGKACDVPAASNSCELPSTPVKADNEIAASMALKASLREAEILASIDETGTFEIDDLAVLSDQALHRLAIRNPKIAANAIAALLDALRDTQGEVDDLTTTNEQLERQLDLYFESYEGERAKAKTAPADMPA